MTADHSDYHTNSESRMHRFFAGITQHTFHTQLGVPDTDLIDYLSALLTRFVHSDMVFKIRGLTGRPLTEVADMLIEADHRLGAARRTVYQHVGDFILFWSGVYPESLARMQREDRKDHLLSYWAEGKRAYHAASELTAEEQNRQDARLLGKLSDQFELCAYGLGEVRREWERREDGESPKIISLE